MSGNIKGIVVEIGGSTTGLNKAIAESNKTVRSLQKELGQINSALKFDPKNIDLLSQRQKVLNDIIKETQKRSEALQAAKKTVDADMASGVEVNREQYTKLVSELSKAKAATDKYQNELDQTTKSINNNTTAAKKAGISTDEYATKARKASAETLTLNGRLGEVVNTFGIKVPAGTGKAITSITGYVAAAAAAITVTVKLISYLVDASKETAKLADDILTLSSTSGMTTDAIQEFNYAAGLLDVETSTISDSLTKMIRSMNSARDGTREAQEAYQKLGIRITDTNGQLRDQNTVFYEVIDRLGKVKNETDRDAISMQIFGRSARDLNPLIEAGSDRLKELATEAHNTGYVMDTETLKSFGALQDSIDRFNNKSLALKATLGEILLPVLIGITDALSSVNPEVIRVVAVIGTLAAVIITTVITISSVIKSIESIAGILNISVNPTMLKTIAIIMLVVAALIALGIIIATIQGRAKEMQHTFESVGNSMGNITGSTNVKKYAIGTSYHPGGRAIVGEEGPELIELPAGSKVYNARRTGQILNNNAGNVSHNYYYLKIYGIKQLNDVYETIQGGPAAARARG
jgi:phage-related minor tail protein